ncbi:MAG TPA: YdcF family protein, partial [Acetobacteraceae bacterium]
APPDAPPPSAIVILSAEGREFRAGGIVEGHDVGPLTLERLRAGALLQRRTQLPVLTSGGLLRQSDPPIARTMAEVLTRDFAVPVRWVEDASSDTWENARLSTALLRRDGEASVYLVTHAWHMRRALLAFSRAGIAVSPAPVAIDPLPGGELSNFVPSASGWMRSYFALHEWIGLLAYALRS